MHKSGFTLVEVILYITIVAIILVGITNLGWGVVNNSQKSKIQQEVSDTARTISERIGYEIRNAQDITSVTPSSISLTNFPPDASTVISLVSGNVQIDKNGTGGVNLNPVGTKITDLTFTNYSVGTSKNIGFTLTVTQSYTGGSKIYKASTSIRSSGEVRSN
jgi:type II secretory pathway pseudopilin PulG